MISFYSEDIAKPKLKFNQIKNWIKLVISNHNLKCGDISIIFCSDNYLLNINNKYLNHNYFTDIITFNYNEEKKISGDIFISIETVKKNSTYYSQTFINELHRVIIHGIFHLIGFDDKTEVDEIYMHKKEDEALEIYLSLFSDH